MPEEELHKQYQEDVTLIHGSVQMIKFAYGLKFAIHGYEIPEEFYPLETTKYLAEQYQGCEAVPIWMLALWGGTAMVQLHESDLFNFAVEFNTWSSEKLLHHYKEPFCSEVLVSRGVVYGKNNRTRCTQCGKLMAENHICIPCYNMLMNKYGIPVETWAKELSLKLDGSWIWTDFQIKELF